MPIFNRRIREDQEATKNKEMDNYFGEKPFFKLTDKQFEYLNRIRGIELDYNSLFFATIEKIIKVCEIDLSYVKSKCGENNYLMITKDHVGIPFYCTGNNFEVEKIARTLLFNYNKQRLNPQ